MSGYHYKFHSINENLFKLLINQELWFSNPKNFNDPYDCNIDVQKVDDISELIELMKTKYKADITQKVKDNPDKVELLKNEIRKIAKNCYEKFGICCFSMNCKHILMWSHYADNHKGVCLKFDSQFDQEAFRISSIIQYVDDYPKIKFSDSKSVDEILAVGKFKFSPWNYEEEIRVLKLDGAGTRKFNMASLKEVIFGANCSEVDKNTIIDLILKFGYDNILFKDAVLEEDKFGIKLLDILPQKIVARSKRMDDQIDNFLEKITKDYFSKTESNEVIQSIYEEKYLPQYEEIFQHACNYIHAIKSKEEQLNILNDHFPKNKKLLFEMLNYEKEKSKNR